MKIQKQPDYLIFADSAKKGENAEFPDISRGWGITTEQTASKPPMEWMNGAFNRIDKNMLYLLQQGVPEWSEKVTYPVNAIIKYNGVLYTAIAENDNARPSTNTTKWKKTQAEIPNASTTQKGIVKLSSATDSKSEVEAATPLAVNKVGGWAIAANNTANNARDIANNAVKRSGDNMTGELYINGEPVLKKRSYGVGLTKALDTGSIDAIENYYSGFLFTQQQTKGIKPFDFAHVIRSFVGDSIADIAIDILSKRAKYRGVITEKRNPSFNGDYSWTEFITTANINNYLPVGIPLPWPLSIPPNGWFECNGSPFNKNSCPKLVSAYPSGFLPDLRGEFIRGWDNGRGVDSGRNILSWQNHQLAAHRHVGGWGENLTGLNAENRQRAAPFGCTGEKGYWVGSTGNDNDNSLFYTNDGTNGSRTNPKGTTSWFDLNPNGLVGNETHPRNVAFMYIVKAE